MENIFVMNGIKKSATKSEPGEFRTLRESAFFLTLSQSRALGISHDHGTKSSGDCTKNGLPQRFSARTKAEQGSPTADLKTEQAFAKLTFRDLAMLRRGLQQVNSRLIG